eukprot:jgi/Chlat1/5715/Chrsp38S05527
MTAGSDLLSSVIINGAIAVACIVLWSIFKRKEQLPRVYYPRDALESGNGRVDERLPHESFFGWFKRIVSVTERDIEKRNGLDGVAFLRIFTWSLWFFLGAAIPCVFVLIPINATAGGISNGSSTGCKQAAASTSASLTSTPETRCASAVVTQSFDYISMANVPIGSVRLWAHWITTYLLSFWAYYLLLRYYRKYADDCVRHFSAGLPAAAPYAIRVGDSKSPPHGVSKGDYVRMFFERIYHGAVLDCTPVRDYDKAHAAAKKLNEAQIKFEKAAWKAEHALPKGQPRPTTRDGLLGLVGQKVDAVEFHRNKVAQLMTDLRSAQQEALGKEQSAAIVTFKTRLTASMASQSLHHSSESQWVTCPAPEPRDTYWSNLSMSTEMRGMRRLIIMCVFVAMLLFFMIPITAISALTTLDNLERLAPFLRPVTEKSVLRTFLQGFLPTVALLIFLALLPGICRKMSQFEGWWASSKIDRMGTSKLFYFMLINSWLGYTVSGSIFSNLKRMIDSPTSIPSLLATGIPQTATFFLAFVLLKALVVLPLELSRLIPVLVFWLKIKFLAKTPREIAALYQPPPAPYLNFVANYLFFVLLGIMYMVIQPLMVVFVLYLFGAGLLVMRNQFLHVYTPKYDASGRMWPLIHRRICLLLGVWQLLMIGLFGLKRGWTGGIGAVLLIPLPIFTFAFDRWCEKRWKRVTEILPLDIAAGVDNVDGTGATSPPDTKVLRNAYEPDFMKDPVTYLMETAPDAMKPKDRNAEDMAAAAIGGVESIV